MQTIKRSFEVDRYIIGFPENIRKKLVQLRSLIHTAAPEAEEIISYKMPAFKYNGVLVYYAGYKNHIGFYPTSSGIIKFKKEFDQYEWSKGAIRFPIDKPLPSDLIKRIVKFRLKENKGKSNVEKATKTNRGLLRSSSLRHAKGLATSNVKGFTLSEVEGLSAPAKRALENSGIKTILQLSKKSKRDLLKLHGLGPGSIPILRKALKVHGFSFKDKL